MLRLSPSVLQAVGLYTTQLMCACQFSADTRLLLKEASADEILSGGTDELATRRRPCSLLLWGSQEGHYCGQAPGCPCRGLAKLGMHLKRVCGGLGHDVRLVLVCSKLEMLLHNDPYPEFPNGAEASLRVTPPKIALEVDG